MSRIQQVIVLVLCVTAFVLFVKVKSLPDIDEMLDIQLRIQAFVNGALFEGLKNSADAGIKSGAAIHDERAVQAVSELKQASAYADSVTNAFDLLRAEEITPEDVAEKMGILKNINKVAIADSGTFFTAFDRLKVQLSELNSLGDVKLKNVAIENIRCDTYYFVRAYLDSLARLTASVQLRFDTELSHRERSWKKGLIAFNPRKEMEVGEHERVQIRISKDLQRDILKDLPSSEMGEVDSLQVGDVMIVRLTGDDFEIAAFDEEEQGVTDEGYTQWEFDVTPKSSGQHTLFVKIGIVYSVPGIGTTRKFFPVYKKEIQIRVNTWKRITTFATERWEFLISTFLIPILTWGWAGFRKRWHVNQGAD